MAIVFFDLDGTTLDKGHPAKGVLESIQALKRNGHIPAIATGRSPVVLYGKDKELEIDYCVLANGAYVSHGKDVIYERRFTDELVLKLMEFVDDIKADLVFEYDDEYVAYRRDNKVVDEFSDVFGIEYPKLDRNFYPNRPIYAMIIFDHERLNEFIDKFPELVFNKSNAMGYDVNLAGEMKAEGVKELIKYLNIPIEDTYAIGDGHNDITMLQAVKHGIAMGNATKEVKEVAEYVTTDVNDYGVMNALKHYGLI